MPSNFTANYNLSQWERTDKIQMEDFNEDNAKIDGALKAEADARAAADAVEAQARAALETQVARCGNCQIWTRYYSGTGTCGADHPTVFEFGARPFLVLVLRNNDGSFEISPLAPQMSSHRYKTGSSYDTAALAWSATSLSVTAGQAHGQFNHAGSTYYMIAFLEKK